MFAISFLEFFNGSMHLFFLRLCKAFPFDYHPHLVLYLYSMISSLLDLCLFLSQFFQLNCMLEILWSFLGLLKCSFISIIFLDHFNLLDSSWPWFWRSFPWSRLLYWFWQTLDIFLWTVISDLWLILQYSSFICLNPFWLFLFFGTPTINARYNLFLINYFWII